MRQKRCNCGWMLAVLALAWTAAAQAQTYKLQCEVEGKLQDSAAKAAPARVTVEMQVIGRHFYFKVLGPTFYEMQVSSLVTEEFKGENLFSASQLGARRQHRSSQRESEIVIERGSLELSAHNDVSVGGRTQRFKYAGKCRQV